jgi:hypothetical protein
LKHGLPFQYNSTKGIPERINMMKMKCVDQRFSLGFKPRRIDYKRAVTIKKERRLTQIEGNRLNKDGKEIPPIHITFP